jgi:hypothetical protein
MDEVIKLMKKCVGAIVLGLPQIVIEKVYIKDQAVSSPVSLGTEWNQIEAALAYCIQLPTLVIHDKTVVRGIFDRGTLNSFIYSFDLADPAWPIDPIVSVAVNSWMESLISEPLKENIRVDQFEQPTLKWGCYKFDGREGLYCPACYESKGLKVLTSRINYKIRKCPLCKAELS